MQLDRTVTEGSPAPREIVKTYSFYLSVSPGDLRFSIPAEGVSLISCGTVQGRRQVRPGNVGVLAASVVARLVVPVAGGGEDGEQRRMTSRRRVFLVGGSDLARTRVTVILTMPWSGRRAIRTTTGRALRVGRWSAPKPRRTEGRRRRRRRRRGGQR